MVKLKYALLTAVLLSLTVGSISAQSRSTMEDEAYDYLNNNDFASAYDIFDKLFKRYPKELDYQFKLGICALNISDKKERAIEIFQDLRTKLKTVETELYLGKSYHRNYRFDEAIMVLQPLIDVLANSKKKSDKGLYDDARLTMKNCVNGKILIEKKLFADITNVGPPINTHELEGVPVINADESMMIFTYVGKKSTGGKLNASLQYDPNGSYLSDIYMSLKDSVTDEWLPPHPIKALNTRGNDAAIALSPDGQTLFTFLSSNENEGDIMVSKFRGTDFEPAVPLNRNINTPEYWEGSCSISSDGKLLYFTSERPGGYGNRDIYVSEWTDGDWGPAVNLGPTINTEYDDDAPFIHPDGVTLFFSSKGHLSIGGYDIMFTTKVDTGWSVPKSMGMPLNTTEDDSYYVLNSKGDKGFFSSTRTGSKGFGSQDIYKVTPGIIGEKPIVGLFKGVVYGDNVPIEAKIEAVKFIDNENAGEYFSNRNTGKYLLTLKRGIIYRITVSADGYESVDDAIHLDTIRSYIEQKRDYFLYSTAYAEANPDKLRKTEITHLGEPPIEKTETKEKEQVVAKNETKTEPPPGDLPPDEPEEVVVAPDQKKDPETKEPDVKKQPDVTRKPGDAPAVERVGPSYGKPKTAKEIKKEKERQEKEAVAAREAEKKSKTTTPKGESRPCNMPAPDLSRIKGRTLNNYEVYRELMRIAGDYCAQGVVFRVQIGAYRKPENFKYANLLEFGEVESKPYPDGITRFTQNDYPTLRDAESHRQKVISRGYKDAWIVVDLDGVRYTLEDFIMVDFKGRAVN